MPAEEAEFIAWLVGGVLQQHNVFSCVHELLVEGSGSSSRGTTAAVGRRIVGVVGGLAGGGSQELLRQVLQPAVASKTRD